MLRGKAASLFIITAITLRIPGLKRMSWSEYLESRARTAQTCTWHLGLEEDWVSILYLLSSIILAGQLGLKIFINLNLVIFWFPLKGWNKWFLTFSIYCSNIFWYWILSYNSNDSVTFSTAVNITNWITYILVFI